MSNNPLRVVIYARCSTSHHEQKPEVQVDELLRFCGARGWHIVEQIVDHGFSGGTDNRPGLKKLLGMVRRREVDAVVTVKMDRLGRSLPHLLRMLEEFHALGVQFVATRDAVDWTTPSGRLFTSILMCLAAFERDVIRERTMMGLEYARSKGKRLGRPKQRDDDTIRDLRRQGLSYTAIQKRLGISRGAVCRALKGSSKSLSPEPSQVPGKRRPKDA